MITANYRGPEASHRDVMPKQYTIAYILLSL